MLCFSSFAVFCHWCFFKSSCNLSEENYNSFPLTSAHVLYFVFPCFVCQSKAVLCPMSGQPIKMNELLDVKFTPLDSSLDRVALLTRQVSRWCPLSTGRGQQILLTGNVLLFQCKIFPKTTAACKARQHVFEQQTWICMHM